MPSFEWLKIKEGKTTGNPPKKNRNFTNIHDLFHKKECVFFFVTDNSVNILHRLPKFIVFNFAMGVGVGGNANFSIFRYHHVGIPHAKLWCWGSEPTRGPNANGFASQWNTQE